MRDVEGHQERSPSGDLAGQDGLDAHRLRRADQVALRAEVDRICLLTELRDVYAAHGTSGRRAARERAPAETSCLDGCARYDRRRATADSRHMASNSATCFSSLLVFGVSA